MVGFLTAQTARAQTSDDPLTVQEQLRESIPGYTSYETRVGWIVLGVVLIALIVGFTWYSRWRFRRRMRRLKPSAVVIAEERAKAKENPEPPKKFPKRERKLSTLKRRPAKKSSEIKSTRSSSDDSRSRRTWRW